ncbi:MAG: AI-2E family transporter [Candidatus Saccharimonadales bacterium]
MVSFRNKKDASEVWINISNRTIIRVVVVALLLFLVVAFLRRIEHALLLIFLAFLLAIALNNPVRRLADHLPGNSRHSRLIATTISYLVVIIILGGIIALIVPPLVHQTNHFLNVLPSYISGAQAHNSAFSNFINHYHLRGQLQNFSHHIGGYLHGATGSLLSTVVKALRSAVSLLTILVLTFMMLVEGPAWAKRVTRIIPKAHQKHATRLGEDMAHVVRGYVNGQVVLAAIAAALITPALFILHINYPLALMVVVFVAGLIPLIGHTIGAIVITAVALFHAPLSALIILLYYVLYINVENYILSPHIQSNTTNLSPLLVILAIVIGVSFGGIFGGLLAIPIAGCFRVIIIDYLKTRDMIALNNDATEPPATADTK